jgi:hypothetical protein
MLIRFLPLLIILSCAQAPKVKKKKILPKDIYTNFRNINLYYGPNYSYYQPIAYPLSKSEMKVDIIDAPIGSLCKLGFYGNPSSDKSYTLASRDSGEFRALYCRYNNFLDYGSQNVKVSYTIRKNEKVETKVDKRATEVLFKSFITNPSKDLIDYSIESSPVNGFLILNEENDYKASKKVYDSTVKIHSYSLSKYPINCKIGDYAIDRNQSFIVHNFTGLVSCIAREKVVVTFKSQSQTSLRNRLNEATRPEELFDEQKLELNEQLFSIDVSVENRALDFKLAQASMTKNRYSDQFEAKIDAEASFKDYHVKLSPHLINYIVDDKVRYTQKVSRVSVFVKSNIKTDNFEFVALNHLFGHNQLAEFSEARDESFSLCSGELSKYYEAGLIRSNSECEQKSVKLPFYRTNKFVAAGERIDESSFKWEKTGVKYNAFLNDEQISNLLFRAKSGEPKALKQGSDASIINNEVQSELSPY